MATVAYAHIELTADGEPVLTGSRFKVRLIALDRIARGWDAEEIQRHHPDLTLGQIYSALSYYYDHKEEMDRNLADRHRQITGEREHTRDAGPTQTPRARSPPVSLALYMDHHVDVAITNGLRRQGIDVLTCQEDGTTTLDDEQLLERATALGRVLFSQDGVRSQKAVTAMEASLKLSEPTDAEQHR